MASDKIEVLADLKYKSSRSTSRKRLKPVIDNLTAYTENTTIHGIKYLGWKNRPIAEKIYWILIFMLCLTLLGFFIREIAVKWDHKFVILVEDDTPTPIHKIPFPAVTICPHYKLKKSQFSYQKFYEIFKQRDTNLTAYNEYLMKYQVAQQVCSYKTTVIMTEEMLNYPELLNKSHIELLYEIAPSLDDMLDKDMRSTCTLKSSNPKIMSTTSLITVDTFSTILTNEGICFTLNLDPDIIRSENVHTEYPNLYYSPNTTGKCSTSKVSRITLNMGTNKSNTDHLCQSTQVGYKVILHSPQIYPTTFENYIAINHESVSQIKVQPKLITTSETLRSYTPKQRQCYFIGERQLKYFKFYNRANCKLECLVNYTLHVYGCVHFAFPHSPGTPICGETIDYSQLYDMVDGLDALLTYLQDHPDQIEGTVFHNVKPPFPVTCDCLSECNSIDYEYTTMMEQFNYEPVLKEIQRVWNSTSYNTPAEFEIVWESPRFKGTIRKQLYVFSDLVSHFGGLLGLFMGGSILSIFEIIYFCVIRQFTKNHSRR